MYSHFHIPAPPLDRFVDVLWLFGTDELSPHPRERVLPTGTVELIFCLDNDFTRSYDPRDPTKYETLSGGIVAGTRSEFMVIDAMSRESILGVHFRPGGAYPFLGVPVSEVHDLDVSLDAVWGRRAVDLRERLIEAPTPAAKFRIMEEALLARISRPRKMHPAVAMALHELRAEPTARKLSDVARDSGLSQRRFIQLFREEVGMTPKLHYRIQRFQRTVRQMELGRRIEWADLALSCGYYDQSHFIRDFRAFSGISPSTYLAHRSVHVNHVPLFD